MNINTAALRHRLLHTKTMEWTNDDALELIEQYRAKTELWNRSDPKYKDKLCRFRAWSEIAERFGCSKAEVERKMNVLLTQYRREKHKMLMKLYQGLQPSPSKWYAFKHFDFMEITVNTTTSGSNAAQGIAGGGGGPSPTGVGGGGGGGGSASNSVILNTSNSSSNSGGITTNGHHPHTHPHSHHHHPHHHHNHHAAAAVAAAAALNGLTAGGYETAQAASTTPTSSHHRRMKSKEMKYFGSVGSCVST